MINKLKAWFFDQLERNVEPQGKNGKFSVKTGFSGKIISNNGDDDSYN